MRFALASAVIFMAGLAPLPWYETQTRLDPIMAYHGTDTAAMRDAAADLQAVAEMIASYLPPDESHIIRSSLVPVRSLYARARLEDARRAFLESPTLARMFVYALALERARGE